MKSLKRNIIISIFYQILKIAVPLFTAPYIARVLGSEQIGIYSYTSSIVAYFTIFAGLGTASYGARKISMNRKDRHCYSTIFWEVELLTVFTSIVVVSVWGIWIVLHPEYQIIYLILTFNILAITFDISWLYKGLEEFQYEITINSLTKLIGIIFIFLLVKSKEDLFLYILINSVSVLIGSLSLWFSAHKFVDRVSIKSLHIFTHVKYTMVYFLPTIAASLYSYLDKTLIGVITQSYDENGFYEQATKIINLSNSLTFFPVNSVLQARNSFLYSENQIDEIKNFMKMSMSGCLYMGVGVCFGLWSLSKEFVPVFFGSEYGSVTLILYILAPIIVLTGISSVYSFQYYNPAGKINYVTICVAISTGFNILMNILMIPHHGAYGAATASVLAELVIAVLYVGNCKKYYGVKDLIPTLLRKVIAGFIMLALIMAIKGLFKDKTVCLFACFLLGAVSYTGVLYILKDDFVHDYGKYLASNILNRIKT